MVMLTGCIHKPLLRHYMNSSPNSIYHLILPLPIKILFIWWNTVVYWAPGISIRSAPLTQNPQCTVNSCIAGPLEEG